MGDDDTDGLEAQVRYYGYYSCAARGKRLKQRRPSREEAAAIQPNEPDPPPQTAALRKRWADLLRRVYEVDPLVCPRCAAPMRVISFITQPASSAASSSTWG